MEKIKISNLGPIKNCELDIRDFMVFTGQQASGKSTVAKSIFFFKNIKVLLNSLIRRQTYFFNEINIPLKDKLIKEIRLNFLQVFGSTWGMPQNMNMIYYYDNDKKLYIKINLKEDNRNPNYIWIEFSQELISRINKIENIVKKENWNQNLEKLKIEVNNIFEDEYETIYIPAGRSLITLLSSQLNYIYSSMEDIQKKSIDYCTQSYLENILRLKTNFNNTLYNMIEDMKSMTSIKIDTNKMKLAADMVKRILKGDYINENGEEKLKLMKDM